MTTQFVNTVFAAGTIAGLGVILFFIFSLFVYKNDKNPFIKMIERWGILIAFIITLGALVGSLFYSAIINFVPCDLCWYQRIFMYPLVFIFGISLWKKDKTAILYSATLSIIGWSIALYHTILQTSVGGNLPCPATVISCSKRLVYEFGFVTMPLMSFTIFTLVLIILGTLYFRSRN